MTYPTMIHPPRLRAALLRQGGFTLIELAIVLVIIGLLLGGALKGQELINNAKIKNVQNQYNQLVAAIYTYQDKYGALPGDDPNVTTRPWYSSCPTATAGNGSGLINETVGGSREYYKLYQHLSCAGIIKGSFNGTSDTLTHAYGGRVYVFRTTIQGMTAHFVRFDDIDADKAWQLDIATDDGVYNTGNCRASADFTSSSTTTTYWGCSF